MMLFVCTSTTCGARFRVVGEPLEVDSLLGKSSDFWPNGYVCPTCAAPADVNYEVGGEPSGPTSILEAQEMFRAQMGLGLPDEQNCQRAVVEKIFRQQRIRRLAGHDIPGAMGFCIEFLEMEDGTRIYFCASSHGAVVYRISAPINHADSVLNAV